MSEEKLFRWGRRILAKDFYASNDTRKTGRNNNDLVMGAPGCNKTGGIVSPTVLETEHSLVVADTKGLLYRRYRRYLRRKGFKVECIDFVNPENSVPYNPFDYIERYEVDGEEHYKETDLNRMISILLPQDMDDSVFWVDSAKLVMISLSAYVIEMLPREEQNFNSVFELYIEMMAELDKCYRERKTPEVKMFESLGFENPDSYAYKTYQLYKRNVGADRTWTCICAFINTTFMYVISREMRHMLCGENSIDLTRLGKERMILFVNTPDLDHSNQKVINLFFTQLFQCLGREADSLKDGRLKIPVRVILDDFAANVKIEEFDKIISVVRSRDIYITIILQSLKQLEIAYKPAEADTIVNNCDQWMYLGGGSTEMIEKLAKKAGCLPETISSLDNDHEWVFVRGMKPELREKEPAYALENRLIESEEEDDAK